MAGIDKPKQAPKAEDILGDVMPPKAEEMGQKLTPEREKELRKGYSTVSKSSNSKVFGALEAAVLDSIKPHKWESGQNATRNGEQRVVGNKVMECNYRVIMSNTPGKFIYLKSPDKEAVQEVAKADEFAADVLKPGFVPVKDAAKIAKIAKHRDLKLGGKPPNGLLYTKYLVEDGILTAKEGRGKPDTFVVKEGSKYKVYLGTEKPA